MGIPPPGYMPRIIAVRPQLVLTPGCGLQKEDISHHIREPNSFFRPCFDAGGSGRRAPVR